jgi:hypothetical protein
MVTACTLFAAAGVAFLGAALSAAIAAATHTNNKVQILIFISFLLNGR